LEKALQYNLLFLPYLNSSVVMNFGHADMGLLFPTNVAAWSLFFELFVNLVFARLVGMKLNCLSIFVALSLPPCFVALLVTSAQPGWSSGNYWGGFPRALYGFFAGVGAETVLRRNPKRSWPASAGVALIAIAGALFASPIGLTYLFSLILAPFIV